MACAGSIGSFPVQWLLTRKRYRSGSRITSRFELGGRRAALARQYAGPDDFAGLKAVIYGGAPMLVEDVKAFLGRFGPRLAQLYGQGESPMTISGMSPDYFADTAHPHWERRLASAGLPQSAVTWVSPAWAAAMLRWLR